MTDHFSLLMSSRGAAHFVVETMSRLKDETEMPDAVFKPLIMAVCILGADLWEELLTYAKENRPSPDDKFAIYDGEDLADDDDGPLTAEELDRTLAAIFGEGDDE